MGVKNLLKIYHQKTLLSKAGPDRDNDFIYGKGGCEQLAAPFA